MTRLTLPERVALRKHYREQAIRRAERTGLSARCADSLDDMDSRSHEACLGETPGGAGCLCRCHDADAREDLR